MTEPHIHISIIDDSGGETCTGNCGLDWSSTEALSSARQQISDRFGERAAIEYIDLPHAAESADTKKFRAAVEGMPMPVLLSNGRPRIAGEFDIRQLMDVIEADLEGEL